MLKCSRLREQKSSQSASAPSPAQKAICHNSGGLTKLGMDAAPQNLYHPKGKCLLNHREPGEIGGGVQGHRDAPKERTVEEGVAPGPGSLPVTATTTTPTLGKSRIEGEKPGTPPHPDIRRMHMCVLHAREHTRTHAREQMLHTRSHVLDSPPQPLPRQQPRSKCVQTRSHAGTYASQQHHLKMATGFFRVVCEA